MVSSFVRSWKFNVTSRVPCDDGSPGSKPLTPISKKVTASVFNIPSLRFLDSNSYKFINSVSGCGTYFPMLWSLKSKHCSTIIFNKGGLLFEDCMTYNCHSVSIRRHQVTCKIKKYLGICTKISGKFR